MGKNFNCDVFMLVRGALGMSQGEMAKSLSWSQGKVSKVEHGLISIDRQETEELSKRLGYPTSLFFEDASALAFGTCCQYDRKKKTMSVRKLNQLHDEINLRRIQLSRLLKSVDLPHPLNFPNLDVDQYGGPEEVARLLRATWQLPRGRVTNLVETVERAGGIVVKFDFPVSKIDAVSQRSLGLPHLFFLDSAKPADRFRFTLTHEIGHLVMHAIPTPDAETEADRFAAEFLMPARDIMGDLRNLRLHDAARLKLKWRVSIQGLVRRAKELKAITESRYKSLCVQISRLGYRKNEPNPIEEECPKMLRWVIDLYLQDRGYSVRELSDAALCNEETFRRDYLEDRPNLKVV